MTTLETRANSKADSSETTTGPVVTLDQVKDALAKVAAHPQCREKMANTIAINSGGVMNSSRDAGRLPREAWETIKPKKFERVLRKCEAVIKGAEEAERKLIADKATLDAIDVIGKQITSLADKVGREAKVETDAKQKADSFFAQLVEKLKEAEPLADAVNMKMKALKAKYIGDRLGNTRFKLALRIARGRITQEQATAADTETKREQRAAANKPSVAVRSADGKPIDTSGFSPAAKAQLEAELAKAAAEPPTPAEPVVEPEIPGAPAKSQPELELPPPQETLEECLDRMMAEARELKSVVPAHTVCVRCITYLAPLMNEPTRAQLRKEISAITNRADTFSRKAA